MPLAKPEPLGYTYPSLFKDEISKQKQLSSLRANVGKNPNWELYVTDGTLGKGFFLLQ